MGEGPDEWINRMEFKWPDEEDVKALWREVGLDSTDA